MTIKSLVLSSTSLAALLVASNVSAADLPKHHSKAPMSIMVKSQPAAFSWDGAYAGAEIGGRFASFSEKDADGKKVPSADLEKDFGKPKGAIIGGVFAGYNANVGNNVILGVDANIDAGKVKSSVAYDATAKLYGSSYKEKLSGAARVRVGYAMDRLLPYVAGGVSVSGVEFLKGNVSTPVEDGKLGSLKTKTYSATGWNIGAGVDYALSDTLILRADYRHNKITEPKLQTPKSTSEVEANDLKHFAINSNDIRVGIAYKF